MKHWFNGQLFPTPVHNPFVISAAVNAVAGLLGRRDERRQASSNTAAANAAAKAENDLAYKRSQRMVNSERRYNTEAARIAELRSDNNAKDARKFNAAQADKANKFTVAERRNAQKYNSAEAAKANKFSRQERQRSQEFNANQAKKGNQFTREERRAAQEYNSAQADKANQFTKSQSDTAYKRSEKRDLRNREWAEEDYAQQKDDFSTQYVRAREAAVKAGLNPLTVLGGQMTPQSGPGGLSSSSYGAGGGIGGSIGSGMGAVASSGAGSPAQASIGSGTGVAASTGFSPSAPASPVSVPMTYGAPVSVQPLVSNAGVLGAVGELGQELTGSNAVQRQTDEYYRDLAQIQLEQARSGVSAPAASGPVSFPEISASRVPVVQNGQAQPAGNFSMSDFAEGFAPTFSGPSTISTLGAETTPDTIGSGMSMISNNYLPGSDRQPYSVFGDVEEAFQLENLPVNIPFIGAQMISRAGRLMHADQVYRDSRPAHEAGSGSPVSFTVPTFGMVNRPMTMMERVENDRISDQRREDQFFRYQESQLMHREGR